MDDSDDINMQMPKTTGNIVSRWLNYVDQHPYKFLKLFLPYLYLSGIFIVMTFTFGCYMFGWKSCYTDRVFMLFFIIPNYLIYVIINHAAIRCFVKHKVLLLFELLLLLNLIMIFYIRFDLAMSH